MKPKLKAIVGLGNPGRTYARTRHNTGARAVEILAKLEDFSFRPDRSLKSFVANADLEGEGLILVVPQTFMNLSGEAVEALLKKKNVDLNNLLVVYDDVALPLGAMRFKSSGSDGGHNGVASIIERLGTKDFARLRLGIGNKEGYSDLSDYVLSAFKKDEEPELKLMLDRSAEAIRMWVTEGLIPTMNCFNKKT